MSGFTDARLLQIASGSLIGASVADVRRGAAGAPGELHGAFDPGKTLGSVTANTRCGLFGTAAELKAQTGAQSFEDAFIAIAEGGERREK